MTARIDTTPATVRAVADCTHCTDGHGMCPCRRDDYCCKCDGFGFIRRDLTWALTLVNNLAVGCAIAAVERRLAARILAALDYDLSDHAPPDRICDRRIWSANMAAFKACRSVLP